VRALWKVEWGAQMSAQLRLYEDPDSLASQLARMPEEMRVWMDWMLAVGAKFEVLDDNEAETLRLSLAPGNQLRHVMVPRARGLRRAWMSPATTEDRWFAVEMPGWVWRNYEPKLERQLGEPGAKTDNERAKRTHWKWNGAPK
jgi:hypothetical protein